MPTVLINGNDMALMLRVLKLYPPFWIFGYNPPHLSRIGVTRLIFRGFRCGGLLKQLFSRCLSLHRHHNLSGFWVTMVTAVTWGVSHLEPLPSTAMEGNEDVARFYTTKHSWRGKSVHSLSLLFPKDSYVHVNAGTSASSAWGPKELLHWTQVPEKLPIRWA